MGKYCFGIDVGGTSVKCGLFQTDGVLVEKWEIPTRKENSGEAILPDIAKTILDKIAERKLDKEEIDGVGIGVPGPVNERGEVPCAVNLFWGFKEVTKELTELTGLPSKAGNDANVAALGEAWKGAAAGAKNVILVTLGTGSAVESSLMERLLAVLMVQVEKSVMQQLTMKKRKPATVVTVDVWSSMRLQQVSFAWHRELWLLQMSRLFFANLQNFQQRMFWMLLKRATK